MNKYTEFRKKVDAEYSAFISENVFFAFTEKDFTEGLEKLNTTEDNLLSIGGGGFLRKDKKDEYIALNKDNEEQYKTFLQDEDNLFDAFVYELGNHEYVITYEYQDALNALGMQYEDLTDRQLEILKEAKTAYLDACD